MAKKYLKPVLMSNSLFDDISNKVCNSYDSYENVCICTIDEVINDKLLSNFNKQKTDSYEIHHTFHGTHVNCLSNIIENGFQSKYNVTSAFGKGTYTAQHAKYSFDYMKNNHKDDLCYMFLCDIIVKNVGLCRKDKDADTFVNNISNPTIFVTRNDEAIYPKYLISFHKLAKN